MKLSHKKIESEMLSAGHCRQSLAQILGVTPDAISKTLSRAKRNEEFTPRLVGKFAKALGVTPREILRGGNGR